MQVGPFRFIPVLLQIVDLANAKPCIQAGIEIHRRQIGGDGLQVFERRVQVVVPKQQIASRVAELLVRQPLVARCGVALQLLHVADHSQRFFLLAQVAVHLHQFQAQQIIPREALDQIREQRNRLLRAALAPVGRA